MKDKFTGDWVVISDDDGRRVIEHASPKWKLPITLLYWYGFRASEIMSLTPQNLQGDTLVVQRLKRGRLTRQALHPEIHDGLLTLAKTKLPTSKLFPYSRMALWKAVQSAGFRAGVDSKYLHPHAFRHRVGRRGAENGRTPHELMAFLGHRSIGVSMMYTDINCNPELSKKFF
jgi:integrase